MYCSSAIQIRGDIVCPLGTGTEMFVFVQVCNRVPKLRSDLQKQAVLVWKPGPSGNSGQNGNPAHLAWGKATAEQLK